MITVLSGNPRTDSRTTTLAVTVGTALAGRLDEAVPRVVDLARIGYRLMVAGDVERRLALTAVTESSLLVVATPTYKGSYTGILKVFLDALPHRGLSGITAVPLVVAGTASQAEAAAAYLTVLLGELAATVTPALTVTEDRLTDLGALAGTLARDVVLPTLA
jgi:FMN reductase